MNVSIRRATACFLMLMSIVLMAGFMCGARAVYGADKVRVTFNANGGSTTPQPMDTEIGQLIQEPVGVTRDNYNLTGWYTSPSGGTKWNFSTDTVTKTMTLYAQWSDTRLEQTITFSFKNCTVGGQPSQTVTVKENGSTVYPGTPSLVGDTQGGASFDSQYSDWYTNSAFTSQFTGASFTSITPVSIDLYARFSRTVRFNYSNGINEYYTHKDCEKFYINAKSGFYSVPDENVYKTGYEKVTEEEVSYLKKQKFKEWYYKDFTNNDVEFKPENNSIAGLTFNASGYANIYAKYEDIVAPQYHSVTLNYNDNSNKTVTLSVPHEAKIVLPTPKLDGATCKGWHDGNTLREPGTNTLPITGDITLDAKYTCTITFALNGGLLGEATSKLPVTISYGDKIANPGTPVKFGYEFIGWVSSVNSMPFDFDAPIHTSQALFAVFDEEPDPDLFKINYDVNGGTPPFNAVQVVEQGVPFECAYTSGNPNNEPTKSASKFLGWYYDDTLWNFSIDVPQGDMTLVAKWVKQYEVQFRVDGKTEYLFPNIVEGSYIPEPSDPERNDMHFWGWEYGTDGDIWDFDTPLTEDIAGGADTFYLNAKLERYPKVTLIYNNDTGYQSTQPAVAGGDGSYYFNFPQNDPRRYGHKFLGWFDASDNMYANDTPITEDIDLTAKWDLADIEICFDPLNGDEPRYITSVIGNKILPVTFDEAGGEVIVSWHTEETCDDSSAVDFNSYTVQGPATLYGKWSPSSARKVTVTFKNVYDETIDTLELDYADCLTKAQTPSLSSDYRFIFQNEYFFDGFTWDFEVPFTTDITLTAYVKHTVTFESDGGSTVTPVDVDHGASFYAPTTPTKSKMVFKGWYKDAALTEKWGFTGDASADAVMAHTTLYAKWSDNTPPVIEYIGEHSVLCRQTLEIPVIATDDGQIAPLTFTVTMTDGSPLPSSIAWDSALNVIRFSPEFSEEGAVYDVRVTAFDGELSSSQRAILRASDIPKLYVSSAIVLPKQYDGTDAASVFKVNLGGMVTAETLTLDTDYTVSAVFSDVNANYGVPVTVSIALLDTPKTTIYGVGGSYSTTADIYKAPGLIATPPDTVELVGGAVSKGSYDLNSIALNKSDYGYKSYSLASVTGDSILQSPMPVNGEALDYTVVAASKIGQTANAEIIIATQNYIDATASIPFAVTSTAPKSGGGGGGGGSIGGGYTTTTTIAQPVEIEAEEPEPEPVQYAGEDPYISGYEDGTIRPEDSILRAEVAQIIYNLYGDNQKIDRGVLDRFLDGEEDIWAEAALCWAVDKGYIVGDHGRLDSWRSITRAEISSILNKVAEDNDKLNPIYNVSFEDVNNHWSRDIVTRLASSGIISGYENGLFMPEEDITRAEAVVLISRLNGRSDRFKATKQFNDLTQMFWGYKYLMNAANGS